MGVASVLIAGLLAVVGPGRPGDDDEQDPGSVSPGDAIARAGATPGSFLDTYVEADGRVVRFDQGGDTVSEGQAYAMLIATAAGRREVFDRVWTWTRTNLMRPDGLLSWRWDKGAIADPSPASDADLDAARALLVAAERFDEPSYRRDALTLGRAVLDHETVAVPAGRVLVAGPWAIDGRPDGPWVFNPSYVSPVATTLLANASDDPRWAELESGSRAAVQALVGPDRLPPDWAQIDADGDVRPAPSPNGLPIQFGYDAARTVLRHAESCDPADRRIAAASARLIGPEPVVAVYDVAGRPQTNDRSALMLVAKAAAEAADGRTSEAAAAVKEATAIHREFPTYYGDAWAVLGPILLSGDALGGCPELEQR